MAGETRAVDDFDDVLDAARALLRATEKIEFAVTSYGGAIALPQEISHASNNAPALRVEMEWLVAAVQLVRSGAPVSRRDERGKLWTRPLTPAGVAMQASLGAEGDGGYLAQLAEVLEAERSRKSSIDAELGVKCGRNNGCANQKVYWPGLGHAGAPACWTHVTADERTALESIYDSARDLYPCPGCGAGPGRACSEDAARLVLVNGRWPKVKSFSKRRVHTVRLDLAAGSHGA